MNLNLPSFTQNRITNTVRIEAGISPVKEIIFRIGQHTVIIFSFTYFRHRHTIDFCNQISNFQTRFLYAFRIHFCYQHIRTTEIQIHRQIMQIPNLLTYTIIFYSIHLRMSIFQFANKLSTSIVIGFFISRFGKYFNILWQNIYPMLFFCCHERRKIVQKIPHSKK